MKSEVPWQNIGKCNSLEHTQLDHLAIFRFRESCVLHGIRYSFDIDF
jgi:hypothetical protein